jgi:hypothetical protein
MLEQIVDYATRSLPLERIPAVVAILTTYPEAAAYAAWVRQFLEDQQQDSDQDAPAHVIARAVRLMKIQKREVPKLVVPVLARRVIGFLQFDSFSTLADGIRSAWYSSPTIHPRQLLFQSEVGDLDLRVYTNGSRYRLVGQILGVMPHSSAPVQVQLYQYIAEQQESIVQQAHVNMLGEFQFALVDPGQYRLAVLFTHEQQHAELLVDLGIGETHDRL